MRRTFVPLALAAWLAASVAGAQLSQTYVEWPNGPAGFLLTSGERKAYAQVKNDAEAQAFIDLFWAKRDPDLNTIQNEFKLDFDVRVEAADKQFSTGSLKGSLSDRAKVLIVMGRPLGAQTLPPGTEEEETTRPGLLERGATQVWLYTKDGKPATKRSDEIRFYFTETKPEAGDFILDRNDRRNAVGLKLLASRPEQLILNPKLTEVPRVGLLPGTKAATPAQEAVFDLQPRPWPEGAAIATTSGVESETVHPIWVWVQFPDSVPAATQAVGRVRKAEGGDVAGSFAAPLAPIGIPGGRAYEFSLPVAAGEWKVDLALLNEGGPIAVTTADAKNEPAPSDGPYISPIFWGADFRQAAQARLGDAYHLGSVQVILRLDNKYKSEESITYGAYVVRPSLDDKQQPQMELQMTLFAGGVKQDEQPYQAIAGGKVIGDFWVFGQVLPLSGFRRGTLFEIEVNLRDAKTGLTRTQKIPFMVIKEEPAAPAPSAVPKG
jgi:GWxTD domain-containing protein